MSRQDDLKVLIVKWERRLQRLKERQAQYGSFTDPGILTEIEDIEKSIETLQTELQRLDENPSSKAKIMSKAADWLGGEMFRPSSSRDALKKADYYLGAFMLPIVLGIVIGLLFGTGIDGTNDFSTAPFYAGIEGIVGTIFGILLFVVMVILLRE